MDAAGTALAQLMRQRMSPVVMVMATPHAEATSRKNQLGIVDLLRPFCVLDQIDGKKFRTLGSNASQFSLLRDYSCENCVQWRMWEYINRKMKFADRECGCSSSADGQ